MYNITHMNTPDRDSQNKKNQIREVVDKTGAIIDQYPQVADRALNHAIAMLLSASAEAAKTSLNGLDSEIKSR